MRKSVKMLQPVLNTWQFSVILSTSTAPILVQALIFLSLGAGPDFSVILPSLHSVPHLVTR